jgi:hypothetical protein
MLNQHDTIFPKIDPKFYRPRNNTEYKYVYQSSECEEEHYTCPSCFWHILAVKTNKDEYAKHIRTHLIARSQNQDNGGNKNVYHVPTCFVSFVSNSFPKGLSVIRHIKNVHHYKVPGRSSYTSMYRNTAKSKVEYVKSNKDGNATRYYACFSCQYTIKANKENNATLKNFVIHIHKPKTIRG